MTTSRHYDRSSHSLAGLTPHLASGDSYSAASASVRVKGAHELVVKKPGTLYNFQYMQPFLNIGINVGVK